MIENQTGWGNGDLNPSGKTECPVQAKLGRENGTLNPSAKVENYERKHFYTPRGYILPFNSFAINKSTIKPL
jgi:hypothetical protein